MFDLVKEMRDMNSEEFNNLDEETQRVILFEADKISEKHNEYTKFELFYIRDIFIETRTSMRNHFRRTITTYTLNTLPLIYGANVQLRFGLNDSNY